MSTERHKEDKLTRLWCPADHDLLLLHKLFLINAATKGAAIDAFFLGQRGACIGIIMNGSVKLFFEDWVLVNGLEFGLEVT